MKYHIEVEVVKSFGIRGFIVQADNQQEAIDAACEEALKEQPEANMCKIKWAGVVDENILLPG